MSTFYRFEATTRVYFVEDKTISGCEVNKEEEKVTLFFNDGNETLTLSFKTYNTLKPYNGLPSSTDKMLEQ